MIVTLNYNYPIDLDIKEILKEIIACNGSIKKIEDDSQLSIYVEVDNQNTFYNDYISKSNSKSFHSMTRALTSEENQKVNWSLHKNDSFSL